MKISEGIEHFYNYQRLNVKKNTLRNYEFTLDSFYNHFGDIELSSITSEDILAFISKVSDGTKQNTKKLRFTLVSAFFSFIKNSIEPDFQIPCDNPALRKLFRAGKPAQFKIIEKDVIDEIIFRTSNPRNRLKDTVTSFQPVNHPKISGKNQRCRGNAVDRQSAWIIQSVAGPNTPALVRLFKEPVSKTVKVCIGIPKKIGP
jgi:hypothetical protein